MLIVIETTSALNLNTWYFYVKLGIGVVTQCYSCDYYKIYTYNDLIKKLVDFDTTLIYSERFVNDILSKIINFRLRFRSLVLPLVFGSNRTSRVII